MRPFLALIFAATLLPGAVRSQRDTLSLNGPWHFVLDSARLGNPQDWGFQGIPSGPSREVSVPHTWNVDPGSEEYVGPAWYERACFVPAAWAGRVILLQFDAVYHDARVWVNGREAGRHIGSGYTRFRLDISSLVKPGQSNRITLMADNSPSRASVPFLRSFDWPIDGGIIRPVCMIAVQHSGIASLHVRPLELPRGNGKPGKVSVEAELLGSPGDSGPASPAASFQVLISREQPAPSAPVVSRRHSLSGGEKALVATLTVDSARVWHFDAPNLYRCEVRLFRGEQEIDRASCTFGFRTIATKGNKVLLNGEPVRLMGVEWMPGSTLRRGMAESPADLRSMLEKMRSVNAIFTRFHWQQAEEVLDWCDRHGVLVQEELPYWGPDTRLNDTLLAIGKSQLQEMIRDHGNHPSIVMWGVGNELASRDEQIIAGVGTLYQYAKSLDPSRLVNYVSNQLPYSHARDAGGCGDVLMCNEYQDTWGRNDPALIGPMLDSVHADFPGKPLVVSEYGLCEPANQGGDERRLRDMIYHTSVFESKPFVAGAIYFCLNDYRTHFGEFGKGVLRQRIHGVFDIEGKAKPSADVLAKLASPLELFNTPWETGHDLELVLVGSSGLPSYAVRGYTLYLSEPGKDFRVSGRRVEIPELLPQQTITVPLDEWPAERVVATIVRPTGEVVLRREFTTYSRPHPG